MGARESLFGLNSFKVDLFAKEFRTKRRPFSDLLRYSSIIENGVILGKGGELIASYRYRGQDMQTASDAEVARMRDRVNSCIKRFGRGWMFHITSSRTFSGDYAPQGAFPDPVTWAIDEERRLHYYHEGAHFENEYVLTITYLPPVLVESRVKEFVFEDEGGKATPAKLAKKELEFFKRTVAGIANELSSDLGAMEPLLAVQKNDTRSRRSAWFDEQSAFIKWCITGDKQPIRLPRRQAAVGLDSILGNVSFSGGLRPKVGNKYLRVLAIDGLSDEGTEAGMLDVLTRLPVMYRWTTRWICEDPEAAKKVADVTRSKWRQMIRGWVDQFTGKTDGKVDQHADDMSKDAEAAMSDISAQRWAFGYWSSTIVLMSESADAVEAAIRLLDKQLKFLGLSVRDEGINCIEAYLGSLPGHGYENLRRPMVHTQNLADLLPLTSVWQGPDENPCAFYRELYEEGAMVPPLLYGASSGGTPFRLVTHVGDLGHAFIGGPPGAGKSTVLALMIAQQFRYPKARVYAFDKGRSILALTRGAGGNFYDLLGESNGAETIGFCPLARIHYAGERAWASDYIATIVELNGVKVDLDRQAEINQALLALSSRPVHMRSFTDLASLVQDNEIRKVLRLYERDLAGGILNAREDTLREGRFTAFEMDALMSMGEKHVIPVLLYIFRTIDRTLDGSPVLIAMDEVWAMLKHPMFAAKIKEWLKVLRKSNAFVIFSTQELADVADSEIASTIFSACQTKILLPEPNATDETFSKLYRAIGLTPREIELVAGATKKRDYYFTSPVGRRMFQLELGPVALAFVGASGREDLATIEELHRMHGREWVKHWLAGRRVNDDVWEAMEDWRVKKAA